MKNFFIKLKNLNFDKKILLLSVFVLIFYLFSNFLYNAFFVEKDVLMSYSIYTSVCKGENQAKSNIFCKTQIDFSHKNIQKVKNFRTQVSVYKFYNVKLNFEKFVFYFSILLLFLIVLNKIFYNRKIEKTDFKSFLNDFISNLIPDLAISFLPIYVISFYFSNNILKIPPLPFLEIILFTLFVFIISYFIFLKISAKRSYALLLAGLTETFFIYYDKILNDLDISIQILIFLGITIIFTVNDKNLAKLLKLLKFFGLILFILTILNGLTTITRYYYNALRSNFTAQKSVLAGKIKTKSDVYIILLDMYAGNKTLNELNYDNSNFYSELNKRGFLVQKDILSNYNKTSLSLSSFLNFDYVDILNTKNEYKTPADAISNSKLFLLFKSFNYDVYYLNSWAFFLGIKADKGIDKIYIDYSYDKLAFLKMLLEDTVFENYKFIFEKQIKNYVKSDQNETIFDEIFQNKAKKLFFAHFLMPHWPYKFNKEGIPLKETADSCKTYCTLNKDSYLNYLEYTNKTTLNFIDKILKNYENSKEKPIIIILGDHGLRKKYYQLTEKANFKELSNDTISAHYNTFLAYYNKNNNDTTLENKTLLEFFRNFLKNTFEVKSEEFNYPNPSDKTFYTYYESPQATFDEIQGKYINLKDYQ